MVRPDSGRLLIGRGCHQQSQQPLHVPVLIAELAWPASPAIRDDWGHHLACRSPLRSRPGPCRTIGPRGDSTATRAVSGSADQRATGRTPGGRRQLRRATDENCAALRLHPLAARQEIPFDQDKRLTALIRWQFHHDRQRRHGGSRCAHLSQLPLQVQALLFLRRERDADVSVTLRVRRSVTVVSHTTCRSLQQLHPEAGQTHVRATIRPIPHDDAIEPVRRRQFDFPPRVVFLSRMRGRLGREIVAVRVAIDGPLGRSFVVRRRLCRLAAAGHILLDHRTPPLQPTTGSAPRRAIRCARIGPPSGTGCCCLLIARSAAVRSANCCSSSATCCVCCSRAARSSAAEPRAWGTRPAGLCLASD